MLEIEKTYEDDNSIMIKSTCSCGAENITIDVSHNEDLNVVDMTFYYECWLTDKDRFKNRVKLAWEILTKGYAKYQAEFIFRNENHIQEFNDAILMSIQKMKEHTKCIKYKIEYNDNVLNESRSILLWAKDENDVKNKFTNKFSDIKNNLEIMKIIPIERPNNIY